MPESRVVNLSYDERTVTIECEAESPEAEMIHSWFYTLKSPIRDMIGSDPEKCLVRLTRRVLRPEKEWTAYRVSAPESGAQELAATLSVNLREAGWGPNRQLDFSSESGRFDFYSGPRSWEDRLPKIPTS